MIGRKRVVLLPVIACLLSGCVSWRVPYQLDASSGPVVSLAAGHTVGQTFVATHAGLAGLELFLSPSSSAPLLPTSGQLRLHLRAEPQATEDLATAVVPLAQITQPAFYSFPFAPLADSANKYYYAFLDVEGSDGSVIVGAASGGTYLDGALYTNHQPLDAQAAFRLAYAPELVLLEMARTAGWWLWMAVVAVLLYVIPGWALLLGLLPHAPLAWAERLGLSIGVSLAVYPVLFLWTDLFNLHLGSLYAWLPVVIGLAVLIWHGRHWRWPTLRLAWSRWLHSDHLWPDLTLMAIVSLVFAVRFWAARDLDAPMWGDAYHHTMIAQLLVDHGGLFTSWQPYADLQTFTYHFGFHTAAAVYHWLTGVGLPQSVLWTGQIMNGLAVLALYPLAIRVGRNRWAGVGAVLVAGLLSPTPMVYINWGRYTQLTGQTILPALTSLIWILLETKRRDWRLIGLTSLVLGGLGLAHYRVLIFAAIFMGVMLFSEMCKGRPRVAFSRLAALGMGAGIIFLPWFVQILGGHLLNRTATQLTTPANQISEFTLSYNAIGDLGMYLAVPLWLVLAGVVGWGLWRRNLAVAQVVGWWGLALIAANPQWLSLPGAGIISSFAVLIGVYIPAGAMLGGALGWGMARWYDSRSSPIRTWTALAWPIGICVILIGAGFWGVRQRFGDRNVAEGVLVTRPDIRAAEWIQAHTPSDARFLVNSFFAYGDAAIVGSDGGWWLPLTARRSTTTPPLTYIDEQGPIPGYVEWTNHLLATIQLSGIASVDAVSLLRERGVSYVYIGQRQGRVNFSGPTLEPSQLLKSDHFRVVYQQDRVWVFALQP